MAEENVIIATESLRPQRVSILIHVIVGVMAGFLSLYVKGGFMSFVLAVILMLATGFAAEKAVGKKTRSWWFSNGGIILLFTWFASWTVFYNLFFAG